MLAFLLFQLKVDWTLNIGNIGSVAVAAGIGIYAVGRFSSDFRSLVKSVNNHEKRIGYVEETTQQHSVAIAVTKEILGIEPRPHPHHRSI